MKALLLLSVLFVSPLGTLSAAEARHALVMGAWEYTDPKFPALPGIKADVDGMAAKLQDLGFAVTVVRNPTLGQAKKAVDDFGAELLAAKGTGLFYFSGHGCENDGKNYLIPTGTTIRTRTDLDDEALSAQRILTRMEDSGGAVNLVFLDCCRNALTKGNGDLAPMRATGTFIGFATASATVAGASEEGSAYTAALLENLGTPGLSVMDMHALVTKRVKDLTGGTQIPFQYSGLDVPFALVPASFRPQPSGMSEAEFQKRLAEELAKQRMGVPPPTSDSTIATPKAGSTMQVSLPGGEKMTFCYCPAGSFTMGSPAGEHGHKPNEAQRDVHLSAFWMAKTECTQAQWTDLAHQNPSSRSNRNGPVEQVSWNDAQGFVARLNAEVPLPSGWRFALPTEAQWEYACRAGTVTPFHFGSILDGSQANADARTSYGATGSGTSIGRNVAVASYPPNAWGLYDMHGNVWEWCQDAWDEVAPLAGGTEPLGVDGQYRVQRGGSGADVPVDCRAAARDRGPPGEKLGHVGFRVAIVREKAKGS